MKRRPDVTVPAEARLLVDRGEVVRVEMTFQYRSGDPLAVGAVFGGKDDEDNEDGSSFEWGFARDLLRRGLVRGVDTGIGDGDVRVWSAWSDDRPVVVLALFSPTGDATMEIDMQVVREFLDATAALVPYGSEVVNVDWALAQIFSGAAS